MAGDPVTQDRRPPVYVGPESLQTGQSLFGRDREVMDLTDLVIAERLVLLYAPSGAGKTSLIQAGLVPALRAEGFEVPAVGGEPGPTAPAVILRVDESAPAGDRDVNRYVRSVLSALERHRPAADRRPADALAGQTLAGYADAEFPDARLDRPEGTEFRPVVLIFDQFEEVLTLDPTDVETKEAFFRAVGDLLNDPGRSAVFAIRQDYLADLRRYFDFLPTRLVARFQLDPLLPRPARDAIVEPAAAAGVTFEAADELIEELRQVYVQQPDGQLESAARGRSSSRSTSRWCAAGCGTGGRTRSGSLSPTSTGWRKGGCPGSIGSWPGTTRPGWRPRRSAPGYPSGGSGTGSTAPF